MTDAAQTEDNGAIQIRGARVHNLKNVDVDIPRGQLVVITGLSGSGKSSLAFDTLFAEGQRRYLESLSSFARQFIHQLERPDVDLIEGLQPTLAIDQRGGSVNPRSTVATATEIYDYLRLLMARAGEARCHQCGRSIGQQSPEQILDDLLALPEQTKIMLLAPFVRGRKGQHREALAAIRKAGFVRVRVDGEVLELDAVPELAQQKNHHIQAIVDRIIVRDGVRPRLADSLQHALRHSAPLVMAVYQTPADAASTTWKEKSYSTEYACPDCNISYEELEPRTFSFNSPYGACPQCQGLGGLHQFDPSLILPDLTRSLSSGAVSPWQTGTKTVKQQREAAVAPFLAQHDLTDQTPLEAWPEADRQVFIYGEGTQFVGLLALLEQEATASNAVAERWAGYRGWVICLACQGSRLRPEARNVTLAGKAIHEITALCVTEAQQFFSALNFAGISAQVATPLVQEIQARLAFLVKVGVNYLTLDRAADTLSGGEMQRIRLASSIGSSLAGVCYVLDEPSIGLHPRDNDRLIEALRELQQQENTVVVVEHDEALMRRCDYLIDLGPGAGLHGGQVVAAGTPQQLQAAPRSLTARYLAGQLTLPTPAARRPFSAKQCLVLEGATANNLQDVTARFPLGLLICVTGVSGSGKSSLINETLAKALIRKLGGTAAKPGPFRSLKGVNLIDRVIQVDQSPIGRTPRSIPATYTGLFDEIRKVFASARTSKLRGYKPGRFSFNVKGGRCETCQGQGLRKLEMNFLPDLWITCDDCRGQRFNRQTLAVRYRGRNIAEVLQMRVDEAQTFFENISTIARMLDSLAEVGLGYLTLGQSSTTLSGGEAQRVKLAAELGRTSSGHTVYILDEPTTGLHLDDIRNLLAVLQRLVDAGNTAIVIEHHVDVMKAADWILDLGPEGGTGGGRLLVEGTPEEVAQTENNSTGFYLRQALSLAVK